MQPMQVFRDVPVLPTTAALRTVYNGGPVWPDLDGNTLPLHCRGGRPMQVTHPEVPADLPLREGPLIWGGQAHRFFGHQVAEYATRVPQALRDGPKQARFLFSLWPGGRPQQVPGFFYEVTDLYGLPRDRIEFVTTPFRAAELWIAPQGEQLGGMAPDPAFLDLLEATAAERALAPVRRRVTYVSRRGMLDKGMAAWPGEGYLCDHLAQKGVEVIRPEALSLRQQLAYYAGAEQLVFAEGSAQHGRQMLGRLEQDVTILVRRPGARLAQDQLKPRCRQLRYEEVSEDTLSLVQHDGKPDHNRALSTYDVPRLLESFARLNVDLRADWNTADYRAACKADVGTWLRRSCTAGRLTSPALNWTASRRRLQEDLRRTGFGQLRPLLLGLLARRPLLSLEKRLRRMMTGHGVMA